jgi:hypothetical protein
MLTDSAIWILWEMSEHMGERLGLFLEVSFRRFILDFKLRCGSVVRLWISLLNNRTGRGKILSLLRGSNSTREAGTWRKVRYVIKNIKDDPNVHKQKV